MSRINRYRKNLDLRKEGKYPGIPLFNIYPKLGRYLPSIPREVMILLYGATGSGKTQFHKRICLNIAMAHMNGKINTKPLFIKHLLEESIEEYEDSLISMLYYDHFREDILRGKTGKISRNRLNSYEKDILTEEEFKKIKEIVSPVIDKLLKEYYILEDGIYHPYGLYDHVRSISYDIGTHYYTKLHKEDSLPDIDIHQYNELPDTIKKKYKWSRYKLYNNDLYPVVVTDLISRLNAEKDKTVHQAISDWSFQYCRKILSKNLKFTILNVGQQTVYSENKTYSYKNELNWEGLKPSLADLGDNKQIAQDHHIILGLFNPYRYASFGKVDKIDLDKSNGRYRSTKILKNRIGIDQIEIPWYFDGTVGDWRELNWENLEEFYRICNI